MLSLSVNIDELNREINALPEEIAKARKDHMEVVGLYLVSECKLDFEEKSRRGTSFNISWKELAESTERAKARRGGWKGKPGENPPQSQIGVDKGLLRNSQSPGFAATGGKDAFDVGEESVTVGYGMKYAEYFDEERTLIPDPAPDEWVEEIDLMTLEWLEELIRKRLE